MGHLDKTARISKGLNVDIYRVDDAISSVRSGCIYDDKGILVGQSFVFEGSITKVAEERLREIGFSIDESEGLTTITTFEKRFYESRAIEQALCAKQILMSCLMLPIYFFQDFDLGHRKYAISPKTISEKEDQSVRISNSSCQSFIKMV